MTDPVLPIVGFVFGAIGFLATVRNGIERILNDVDRFKRHGQDLVPLLCETELLSGQLEIWKRFWRIYEGAPARLLDEYWGSLGAARLEALLASANAASENVQLEFERRYGHVIYALEDSRDYATLSQDRRDRRLRKHIKKYKEEFPVLARANVSLFKGPLFRLHLDALKASVSGLEQASLVEYMQEWTCDASDVESHVRETGTQFLLTRLAEASTGTSKALLEILRPSDDLIIDLQANQGYGVPVPRRSEVLAVRAGDRRFPYHFRIRSMGTNPYTTLDATVKAISAATQGPLTPSLDAAVSSLLGDRRGEASIFFRHQHSGKTFKLSQVTATSQATKSLRAILRSSRPLDMLQSLHGEFSWAERIKLAYELAETALLLLQTNWFQGLCSCAIHRACIAPEDEADGEYSDFRLRMTYIEHIDSESGQLETWKQWCEEELKDMHIRRLGLLFIEIALGIPVLDAGYDKIKRRVELEYSSNTSCASDRTRPYIPQEIAQRVEQAAGEDFSQAVEYCLRQGKKPEDITSRELEGFYNRVVAP